jgi:hypothetical protein
MEKTAFNRMVRFTAFILALSLILCIIQPVTVKAQVYILPDGTVFDSDFYAALYPEMQAGYAGGKYPERLLWHYLTYGIKEGRIPSLYSMYNPTPAIKSTPNVYLPGSSYVVPVQYLYPYTPYFY